DAKATPHALGRLTRGTPIEWPRIRNWPHSSPLGCFSPKTLSSESPPSVCQCSVYSAPLTRAAPSSHTYTCRMEVCAGGLVTRLSALKDSAARAPRFDPAWTSGAAPGQTARSANRRLTRTRRDGKSGWDVDRDIRDPFVWAWGRLPSAWVWDIAESAM